METEMEKEKYMKPEEIAEWLSLTKDQVLELAHAGNLPCVRFNKRVLRFLKSDIKRFLERQG